MSARFPISDMHLFPLSRAAGERVLLREADHLLRRFGQLSLLDLPAGAATPFELRAESDRFFFPLSGAFTLRLLDLRPNSPSLGAYATVALDQAQPQGVLAPFGVACSLLAQGECRVLVLSTHSAPHPGDRAASAEELAKYGAA